MTRMTPVAALSSLALAIALLAACSSDPRPPVTDPLPLNAANINLIFVASEDLAYSAAGDMNPNTANLTDRGLQRSLLTASFLQRWVLGTENVNGIYALEPMTHLQTSNNYPDMVPLESIEQFAVLNQITLSSDLVGGTPYAGQNYPINASYAPGAAPSGVAVPQPFCPTCQGIDFNDTNGDNESLANGIITAGVPGFYVFSAPWETTSGLMANLNRLQGYNLTLPSHYESANYIYAISIAPSGGARLLTYNSNANPASSYPALPAGGLVNSACAPLAPASINVTVGVGGAVLPQGINTDEAFYLVRHAEAHPQGYWSDNNYVGAGQWRALDLPTALSGKISPDQVWSTDPAQFSIGTVSASTGDEYWSAVAPPMTVAPYAIANQLPYELLASINGGAANAPQSIASFFFTGGAFSNHKVLLGMTFQGIPPIVNALLASYYPNGGAPTAPTWSASNYDSVWILTLDGSGNLKADFSQCEGIASAKLPAAPPEF